MSQRMVTSSPQVFPGALFNQHNSVEYHRAELRRYGKQLSDSWVNSLVTQPDDAPLTLLLNGPDMLKK